MRKSVNKKTGSTVFHYKFPKGMSKLEGMKREIEKCNKGIEDNERYLDWYKWNYEKAKKEYESRVNKIKDLKDFKGLLEEDVCIQENRTEEFPDKLVGNSFRYLKTSYFDVKWLPHFTDGYRATSLSELISGLRLGCTVEDFFDKYFISFISEIYKDTNTYVLFDKETERPVAAVEGPTSES